jgi:hypothetical protein
MRTSVLLVFIALGLAACADSGTQTRRLPYNANETTVIGSSGSGGLDNAQVVSTPDGTECINLDDVVCATPQSECGNDGTADVLVDENGTVLDVVCYPSGGVSVETFDGPVENVGNSAVLVIDDVDDGVDVDGDVTIDGNNVVLFGAGPDTSVIGGNLNIDKNNAIVRGVRIQGDVVIDKNNPSLIDCVIEGDLLIKGNNVNIALCEVWGTLTIEGNNAKLVSNHFAQAPSIKGKNTVCNDNVAFADANDDGEISPSELGAAIDCTDNTSAK